MCGWLRGARRAAARPQRGQHPHQRTGRSAPPAPSHPLCCPNIPHFWSRPRYPGQARLPPAAWPALYIPTAVPDPSVSVPWPRCPFISFSLFSPAPSQEPCPCFFQTFLRESWPVPGAYQSHLSSPKHPHVCLGPSCPKSACSSLTPAIPISPTGFSRHPTSVPASPTLGDPHPIWSELGIPCLVP